MNDSRVNFDALAQSHAKRLLGFFRGRVRNPTVASDLVQQTWLEVTRRIGTFDPERGSFWSFTQVWAHIVLKRHWAEGREQPTVSGDADEGSLFDGLPAESLAPERAVALSRTLLELLCRVTACSRPPHEIIVFGLSKMEWKPSEIAGELSEFTLNELASKLEQEYAAVVPAMGMDIVFCPLRGRLNFSLSQIIADPRTRRSYPSLLDRLTGETRLGEYFPADRSAEEAITRWWDSVKRSVAQHIQNLGRDAPS